MPPLCLSCRREGHSFASCQAGRSAFADATEEAVLLERLRGRPSAICGRCKTYELMKACNARDLMDQTLEIKNRPEREDFKNDLKYREAYNAHILQRDRYVLILGDAEELQLHSDCPVCRLIFSVTPRLTDIPGRDKPTYRLRAIPAYERQPTLLDDHPSEEKAKYAVYFVVDDLSADMMAEALAGRTAALASRAYDTFALLSNSTCSQRTALAPREVAGMVDFSRLRQWIDTCCNEHGFCCQPRWTDELKVTRMIDVDAMKLVTCPDACEYIALSYVWGGVSASVRDLSSGTLPKTIQDALKVTKELGKRYLWVDALCVEQTGSAQQAQQLALMDTIYECAFATIIALTGENANDGLKGLDVSDPRIKQVHETVEGLSFITVLPHWYQEMSASWYDKRAWTMQEKMLSRRRIIFGPNQVHFACNSATFWESIDESNDPLRYLDSLENSLANMWEKPQQIMAIANRMEQADKDYRLFLSMYTIRNMTQDDDSLNAIAGLLSYLRKSWQLNNFIWGLPMKDFPQSLRWYHTRHSQGPRRRTQFPSWSWCGWEGEVTYSDALDLVNHSQMKITGYDTLMTDMTVRYQNMQDQVLTVEGYLVTLDIRTNPFSEAYTLGSDILLGIVKERDFLHNNTLPSGTYHCLVVERLKYKFDEGAKLRQYVYLLLLQPKGLYWQRYTKVRLSMEPGLEFEISQPSLRQIQLI